LVLISTHFVIKANFTRLTVMREQKQAHQTFTIVRHQSTALPSWSFTRTTVHSLSGGFLDLFCLFNNFYYKLLMQNCWYPV